MILDPGTDLVTLLRAVVDVESVSGNEKRLADLVEEVLRTQPHLEVARDGDCVVARTRLSRAQRVLIAGHLDTVPVAGNLPSTVEETPEGIVIHGRGTVDMKGGVAVALKLACELDRPRFDITWVFYDHEEVDASLNGLGRLAGNRPDLLEGDFAVLMEPTGARVEGGCQGTIRIRITAEGRAAHSARAWMGDNAIHGLADVLARLKKGQKMNCWWCSTQRRTELLHYAIEHKFNKIALGHHLDDILETLLMNMLERGELSTMPPKLSYKNYPVTILRPLCYVGEKTLVDYARLKGFASSVCTCDYQDNSGRKKARLLLEGLTGGNDAKKMRLFLSLKNVRSEYLP